MAETNTDKDTWNICMTPSSNDDIILWTSDLYSDNASQSKLENECIAQLKSGIWKPGGMELTAKEKKASNSELLLWYFNDWKQYWFSGEVREDTMEDDLVSLEIDFADTDEYIPTGGVFVRMRGWSEKGIGHQYTFIRCAAVNRLLSQIRKVYLPVSIEGDEQYWLCCPAANNTLTLQFVSEQTTDENGNPETDEDGNEYYSNGTELDFWAVKEQFVEQFAALRHADTAHVSGLNKFVENFIAKDGWSKFQEIYLMPLGNVIKHVMQGASLDPEWDIRVGVNKLDKKK